ncbi:MAG: hypothetical protein JKY32_07545 [Rhizobiales bacterium]|nr:hypothetical protein [Hyphomicrobiales bacterium]
MTNIYPTIIITVFLFVSACGTAPGVNSDVPSGIHMGPRPTIAAPGGIQIVKAGPTTLQGGEIVQGVSCKSKLWDPSPSRENAINLMKKQAAEKGFSFIHSVAVSPSAVAVAINCWTAIEAKGIAFNLAKNPS